MSDATRASFLCSTVLLLRKAKQQNITSLQIYAATGLSPNWLSALLNDKIPDPSVNRVQTLHDYLTGVCI